MPSSSQQQQQQPPPVSSSTTTALSSTPSLCGSFLQNKRSLIAFTWTVTTFCTWIACFLAIALSIQISSYYNRMEQNYVDEQNQGDPGRLRRYLAEEEDSNDSHDSNDQQHSGDNSNAAADSTATLYYFLAHTSSSSMAFVSAYMTVLALGLTLYGSTAIVGFTSLQGDYIAPCIGGSSITSGGSSLLRDGVFGGAVVMFANLLLVCAVIFGEFRVEDSYNNNNNNEDNNNNNNQEDGEREHHYAVERIASVLAVTCVFLAVLYSTFAILLFLNLSSSSSNSHHNDSSLEYYSDETMIEMNYRHHHDDKNLRDRESSVVTAAAGGHHQQFITIDSSHSSGGGSVGMMYGGGDNNNNNNNNNKKKNDDTVAAAVPTLPSQGFIMASMTPSDR